MIKRTRKEQSVIDIVRLGGLIRNSNSYYTLSLPVAVITPQ